MKKHLYLSCHTKTQQGVMHNFKQEAKETENNIGDEMGLKGGSTIFVYAPAMKQFPKITT